MAKNSVGTKQLKSNAVTAAKIKNEAVTTGKLAGEAVTTGKIANDAFDFGAACVTSWFRSRIAQWQAGPSGAPLCRLHP